MSAPEQSWVDLQALIETAMPADRYQLRRRLHGVRRQLEQGRAAAKGQYEQLLAAVEASAALLVARQSAVPQVHYDSDLPILAKRPEITDAIRQFPVVIVCGETGSGKSTQLPKICLDMGLGIERMIGHTQPRRLAARTIAARLAHELRVPLGQQVGFKIRFTDRIRPDSYIKVMTDGVLLAETQSDRFLDRYDTIILDEAHERSLNIDFLLGYLQRLLSKRRDLKVIVTSATLDAARFSQFFASARGPAPIIEVSGRSYPVEVRYRPPAASENDADTDMLRAIADGVEELMSEGPGDILVFLATERHIREATKMLRGWAVATGRGEQVEFLPLYARLTQAEQDKIFAAHKRRRIVLATNVAESSLTVPDVRYVIDTGTARISRFSPKAKVQRLPIEAISRASAQQRRGRCGRIGPGICLRLYSEDDFVTRDEYTTPEIRRVNLAAVVLQTLALKLGPIDQFPFLDPPRPDAVRHGYRTLFELGAIDEEQTLTDIGRTMARMPVDPRIGRMVIAAQQEGCLHDVLIIAAALEIQDPRDRPADRQADADAAHRQWADERSDFMSYLKLWDFYHHLRENLSRNQLRKACQQNFLSLNRLREWSETYRQLRRLVEESGQSVPTRRDDYAAIHRALLTGLLSGLAYRREVYEYLGAGGQKWFLWPGSAVFARRPKWVMAAEIVETSRRYGRTVAEIDPSWIEPLAQHLVHVRHVAPFWSRKRGAAMVYEKVSLFGLPIVASRPVPFGKVDADEARRMFIDHGLVQADMANTFRFLDHNQRLLRSLHDDAARMRRGDWLIAETAQLNFYDERLPKNVYDLQGLKQWLPEAERQDPERLRMQAEDLLPDQPRNIPREQFPDDFALHETRFPLQYKYEPGHTADGITVTVPCQLVRQLTADQFEWLVPGRLEEKIAALIRTLPKSIRRCLVPAPDTARDVAATLSFGSGPFLKTLAKSLERRAGMPVPVEAFRLDQLPDHLRMNFRVVDEQGQTVASGRDIESLARRLAGAGAKLEASVETGAWQREGLVTFDIDELPESIELRIGSIPIHKYPALVDRGNGVDLRLFDSPAEAARRLPGGLRRLFVLAEAGELRSQLVWLPRLNEIRLLAATWPGHTNLDACIVELLAERAFLTETPWPRSREAFQQRLETGRQRIGLAVQDVTALLHPLFQAYHDARLAWEQSSSSLWQYAVDDIERQMAALLPADFLVTVPWNWLQHYPRYLRAISYRLERLQSGSLPRDQKNMQQLQPLLSACEQAMREHTELGIEDDELTLFRWMLEEFRVSLFAQQLGTSLPTSVQRLEKQWQKVRRP